MTILIPYKQDIHDGEELRFALRSIDKYLTGYTNLIIIGTPPEWYNGEYVNAQDYIGRKQYTIYTKLLIGCELKNITDDFVMWNDDHFLLKSLDINNIENWHEGSLADITNKAYGARYYQAIQNTLEIFPKALNYDIHIPCIYNKNFFKFLFSNKGTEICIKSFYFNYMMNHHYYAGQYMSDLKINQLFSEEAINELIKDRLFFSTGSNGMRIPMIKVLNQLYPTKSRYERT